MPKRTLFYYTKHPLILKTSLKTALFVGTILAFINHGESILAFKLNFMQIIQIITTYSVPFLVATYAAAKHAQCSGELEEKSGTLRQDKC